MSKSLGTRVAVLGGAGGIGQSFCLLLKQSPLVSSLAIYDLIGAPGVAADLSHVNTRCTVTGYGPNQLAEALTGADVVVITAGKAQQPGKTLEDIFETNAPIIAELVTAVAKTCPKTMLCIVSNPVNSLVPIAAQVMHKHGVLDMRRIFGIMTLNVMRASLFAAQAKRLELGHVFVPVIGGHSEKTTVPVFSQIRPAVLFSDEEQEELTTHVRNAIFEVISAKAGHGSATLSMAHAGYHFVSRLLEAMHGIPGIVMCAYVRSDIADVDYFCSPLLLGPGGVEVNLGVGPVSSFEKELMSGAIKELKKDISLGNDWFGMNAK